MHVAARRSPGSALRQQTASSAPSTALARVAGHLAGFAIAAVDLTPPGIRYGYLHPLTNRLLRRPLRTLPEIDGVAFRAPVTGTANGVSNLRCGLLADELDVGGIGRVVEMLGEGLASAGIAPVVVCPAEGDRTARLRGLGIEVCVAADGQAAAELLATARLDVLELHCAPRHLVDAALAHDTPLVPVLHNTEVHYDADMWRTTAALFRRSEAVVAVSEIVRRFHVQRLPQDASAKIVVVANGSMPVPPPSDEARARARAVLARTIGQDLAGDVVVCCLARYDSQKNIAGTVAAFLRLAARDRHVRLVIAGDASDWLELSRADAIRRAHPDGDRVHLLGRSDAPAMLVASDAFVLDSFFEGWPLAATEAVAAGLPVVLSDTGGAAELVARAAPGSGLVSNPTGPAELVTDHRARAARRRALRQSNAPELADSLGRAVAAVRAGGRASPPADTGFDEMIRGHAMVMRAAIGRRAAEPTTAVTVHGAPTPPKG